MTCQIIHSLKTETEATIEEIVKVLHKHIRQLHGSAMNIANNYEVFFRKQVGVLTYS